MRWGRGFVAFAGAGLAIALVILLSGDALGRGKGRTAELVQLAFKPSSHEIEGDASGDALYKGQLLKINVPATQLSQSRVGDVVTGKLAETGGGVVDFTGAITGGTEVSATQGAVTVRVISDNYIAPGTEVSGRVGTKMFSGTVTQSPTDQERLGNMEKRLSTLEGPAKHQVADFKEDLDKMRGRLRTLEGRKTIKERLGDLDSRIHYLEHGSPSLDSSLIKDNAEGFHFHGSIGPNTLTPHLEDLEKGISQVEREPGPEEVVEPVANRLADVEARMQGMQSVSGMRRQMGKLEKRIIAIEKRAATVVS